MTGCFGKQKGKTVLGLADLLLQVEHRALYLIVSSFHLRYGRFIRHSGVHQGAGGCHGFFPCLFRLPGDGELLVQHQQRIVSIGYSCNQLGTHSLAVVLALGIQCLGLLLGIAHTAENIQFPTGGNGQ